MSKQPRSERARASTSKSSTSEHVSPDRVLIGRIVGHFGLRGDVKLAAADGDALKVGLRVVLAPRDEVVTESPSQIMRLRPHQKIFVVGLAGIDNADAAARLHGANVLAARHDLPRLPPRTFREIDLVGLLVVDEALGSLGMVQSVRRYPSCDMLVVGPRELLVPLLAAYGVSIDRKKRVVRVRLPRGFEEL